jgi:ubiquinone/menaquinone biosynthesis C-methylase UbiE
MTPARTPSDTLFSSALPSNFAESYEGLLVTPLFRPWAEILLDRLSLGPRARVLDIACGTGIAARLANKRLGGEGHVVGVDRSPVMLAVARAVAPEIDWRE